MVQFRGFPAGQGSQLQIVIQRTWHRVDDVYSDVESKASIRDDLHSLNEGAVVVAPAKIPRLCCA